MFRKSAGHSTKNAASVPTQWDSDSDLETYMTVASTGTPEPSTSNTNLQPQNDNTDSDSSFDRFLEEQRQARGNGRKKKVLRKKPQQAAKKKVQSRGAQAVGGSEDVSSPSENEFDSFIRCLGSLPGTEANADRNAAGAPASKRRARTERTPPSTAELREVPAASAASVRTSSSRTHSQRLTNVASFDNFPRRPVPETRTPASHTVPSHTQGATHSGRMVNHRHSPRKRRSATKASAAAASASAAAASSAASLPSVIDISEDQFDLHLSPNTIANNQLAEDQVFARNLQEQMDREYAAQLANGTPPPPYTPVAPPNEPRPPSATVGAINVPGLTILDVHPSTLRRFGRGSSRVAHSAASHTNFSADLANAILQRRLSVGRNGIPISEFPEAGARQSHRAGHPSFQYEDLVRMQDRLGDAQPGMSKGQLNMLPTKVHQVTPGEAVIECPICCEDYASKDLIKILTCFHEFHDHCISAWLKNHKTCPICRVEIQL